MQNLESILKLTENELEAVAKNGKYRSREEIDSVYKLIDIAKDIYCIWNYENEDDMSYDGRSYRSYDNSYDGYSNARGRGGNAKRDRMGRYSLEFRDGRSMRGYSRDGREEYMEHLRDMMEDAPDEQTRQGIKRMLDQMQQ